MSNVCVFKTVVELSCENFLDYIRYRGIAIMTLTWLSVAGLLASRRGSNFKVTKKDGQSTTESG